MTGPWQQIKQLPWISLFQAAGLTAIAAIFLEILLGLSFRISIAAMVLKILLSGAFSAITVFGTAIAVGAFAVFVLERLNRFSINIASLWALVLCLAVVIGIAQVIGLLAIGIVGVSYIQVVGFVLGVFWKGRPHWKHYQRW